MNICKISSQSRYVGRLDDTKAINGGAILYSLCPMVALVGFLIPSAWRLAYAVNKYSFLRYKYFRVAVAQADD